MSEWIATSRSNPPISGWYIVAVDGSLRADSAWWQRESTTNAQAGSWTSTGYSDRITHWQSFPDPPRPMSKDDAIRGAIDFLHDCARGSRRAYELELTLCKALES